jgi:hypothetical protein
MQLSDVLSAVTSFVNDWSIFIVAGLVVGLGSSLLRRLIKSGR